MYCRILNKINKSYLNHPTTHLLRNVHGFKGKNTYQRLGFKPIKILEPILLISSAPFQRHKLIKDISVPTEF